MLKRNEDIASTTSFPTPKMPSPRGYESDNLTHTTQNKSETRHLVSQSIETLTSDLGLLFSGLIWLINNFTSIHNIAHSNGFPWDQRPPLTHPPEVHTASVTGPTWATLAHWLSTSRFNHNIKLYLTLWTTPTTDLSEVPQFTTFPLAKTHTKCTIFFLALCQKSSLFTAIKT